MWKDGLNRHQKCDAALCGPGDVPPRNVLKTSIKMVCSEVCFNLHSPAYRGETNNKTTSKQHITMFIVQIINRGCNSDYFTI